MRSLTKILYVTEGLGTDEDALRQALQLAKENGGQVQVMLCLPELPATFGAHEARYEDLLRTTLQEKMHAAALSLDAGTPLVMPEIAVARGSAPAVQVIQHVLRRELEVVVKQAQLPADGHGFDAFDMNLLRKCPCPVWLCRPGQGRDGALKIGVAIDPESAEAAGHALSLKLLQFARALADQHHPELAVLSCWSYPFEDTMRASPWLSMSEADVDAAVADHRAQHRAKLEEILAEAGIAGGLQVHHVRGKPAEQIPALVKQMGIDVLVVGTVARTGIPGFFMGNTAENLMQQLACTVVAMKPPGFVGPVTL